MTYDEIRNNEEIKTYIKQADRSLEVLGYTEHSFPHLTQVAMRASNLLETLEYSPREVELSKIAGYLHDIGNMVNRVAHSQSGALIAFDLMKKLGFEASEIATVTCAIGNHDEGTGVPVGPVAAALILADKSDVRRSRVRDPETRFHDIHDRVNYSVLSSELSVDPTRTAIVLSLTLDTTISSVMDYFEIFTERMLLCRRAAESLGLRFSLLINDQTLI